MSRIYDIVAGHAFFILYYCSCFHPPFIHHPPLRNVQLFVSLSAIYNGNHLNELSVIKVINSYYSQSLLHYLHKELVIVLVIVIVALLLRNPPQLRWLVRFLHHLYFIRTTPLVSVFPISLVLMVVCLVSISRQGLDHFNLWPPDLSKIATLPRFAWIHSFWPYC